MGESKIYRVECDHCGKQEEVKDTIYLGGHPFSSWIYIRNPWSTNQSPDTYCSLRCAEKGIQNELEKIKAADEAWGKKS